MCNCVTFCFLQLDDKRCDLGHHFDLMKQLLFFAELLPVSSVVLSMKSTHAQIFLISNSNHTVHIYLSVLKPVQCPGMLHVNTQQYIQKTGRDKSNRYNSRVNSIIVPRLLRKQILR